MASGLFSSMAMVQGTLPMTCRRIAAPTTTCSPFSRRVRKSEVRYGSHSQPLMMTRSHLEPGGGESLTCVGKVAPPRPTTPPRRILSRMALLSAGISVTSVSVVSMPSSHSSPSTAISMQVWGLPARSLRGPMDLTVPETEEWMNADTKPPGSATTWPTFTLSPTATTGFAGAPMCWDMDRYTVGASGSCSIAHSREILLSCGWTPPMENVLLPIA